MLFVAALFVALLVAGVAMGELEWRHLGLLVLVAGVPLAAVLLFGWPLVWYTAALALLDVALVLWVFKGNLQIR